MQHAEKFLEMVKSVSGNINYSNVNWLCRYRDVDGIPTIVAFSGSTPIVKFSSRVKEEQHSFENLFSNAGTVIQASDLARVPDCFQWSPNDPSEPDSEPDPTPSVPKIEIVKNSPNQSARNATISMIVLHNTAGSFDGAVSWLCNSAAQASAHYVISREGEIAQLVPDNRKAWHAGNARINAISIGIELEATDSHQGMTTKMDAACKNLVRYLMQKYDIPKSQVGIHRWYRQTDCPGLIWPTDTEFKAWRDTL